MARQLIEVSCVSCGKPKSIELRLYNKSKSKIFTCNKVCLAQYNTSRKHKSDEILVKCSWCGKEKHVNRYRVNKTKDFYCNTQCQMEWRKIHWKGENNPQFNKTIPVACDTCGKIKLIVPSEMSRAHHFCDMICQGKWKSTYARGPNSGGWKGNKIEIKCAQCGKSKKLKPKVIQENTTGQFFCDRKCMGLFRRESGQLKGVNNKGWKGGKSVVWFDTYARQLQPIELVRRDPESTNHLQIKCAYCGRWFSPNLRQVSDRIAAISGKRGLSTENRFYCSQPCKRNCGVFRTKTFVKTGGQATSREVQPELRQIVFERDLWECQICGDENNLHCHHIEGVAQNPIESADVDNCVTLCKTHHKLVHSKVGCRYSDLKCRRLTT
jgi:hypothetical protein